MPRTRATTQQNRYHDTGVTFYIAMDTALEHIGAVGAMTESAKDDRYLDAIIDEAFEIADNRFNTLAESHGRTGAIAHMYEWGTLGINRGASNMRQQPNSPKARLWHSVSQGTGADRTLWYVFRPSVANVPKPTVRDTGMSSEVIRRMKDHVFTWKAEVMEQGQEVTIKPKKAKFLLIPAYEENRPYMRPHDVKRGYMLTNQDITVRPGYNAYAGNFTQLWMGFWSTVGADFLEEHVNYQVVHDYEPEFRAPRGVDSLVPVNKMFVKQTIQKKSKKIQKKVLKKAQRRRISAK